MTNESFWVHEEPNTVSAPTRIRVDCITEEAEKAAIDAWRKGDNIGYKKHAWRITAIKKVCSSIFYFDAKKVERVKGASFSVAFKVD